MMQAYTEEQRKALIEFTKQRIEALRFSIKQHAFESIRKSLQSELAVAEIAMAALTAKPVGYGMQRKDNATFGSWLKPKHLVKENLIYRPAPLYLAQPVTATAIPAGWKLVPVEPTKGMVSAGQDQFEECVDCGFDSCEDGSVHEYSKISSDAPYQVFKAMVAAAPEVE